MRIQRRRGRRIIILNTSYYNGRSKIWYPMSW